MRNKIQNKKYSFFRFDKYFSKNYTFNFQIVKNGGWHFGWIKSVDEIIKKVESFAHTEYNNNKYKNYEFISDCIEKNLNFLNTAEKLKEIDINLLPLYLIENKNRFKKYFK